jgi:hypothetical protein
MHLARPARPGVRARLYAPAGRHFCGEAPMKKQIQRSKWRLVSMLLPAALVLGPIGCAEVATPLITTLGVVGLFALTIHEFQKVESAQLDNDLKRLRLEGERNGLPVTVIRDLSDTEFRSVSETGQVRVNGQVIKIRSN